MDFEISEAKQMEGIILEKNNIKDRIFLEEKSVNTLENMILNLENRGYFEFLNNSNSIGLLADPQHLRRSYYYILSYLQSI